MNPLLVPGAMVRHPTQPDWGVGHVQSVIGERVTVNFEEQGKVLINAAVVELQVIERERRGGQTGDVHLRIVETTRTMAREGLAAREASSSSP